MFGLDKLLNKNKDNKKEDKRDNVPVEVTSNDNNIMCLATMHIIKDGEVEIRDRHNEEMMPIVYNTQVKLRGRFDKDKPFVWGGRVHGSSPDMWRVGEIEVLADKENREYARHAVSIKGQVLGIKFDGSEMIRTCNIKDISLAGVKVDIPELLHVGAKFRLTFDYNGEVVVVPCTIKRIVAIKDRVKTYGCQFEINNKVTRTDIEKTISTIETNEARRL